MGVKDNHNKLFAWMLLLVVLMKWNRLFPKLFSNSVNSVLLSQTSVSEIRRIRFMLQYLTMTLYEVQKNMKCKAMTLTVRGKKAAI